MTTIHAHDYESPMFPVPRDARHKGATEAKWFAGLAMQAMIAKNGIPETEAEREEIALWAYRMGQAMVSTEHQLEDPISMINEAPPPPQVIER